MMNDFYQYDDKRLIALLRESLPIANEAFNVIYYRYSEKLKSYCLFKTDNRDDAKDIFQESWLRFHAAALAGKCEMTLPAYLYAIARNLSIDKFRVKKNRNITFQEDFDFEQLSDAFSLQDNIENKELLTLINVALNRLSEINRETFILKWISGLTFPEIADVLGESVDCVKRRGCRAIDEVINILKPVITEINR